jgi:5-methylcytosine-specific restriction enzyme subunit McrC
MNRFFQALLSRFLGEYLTDYRVEDEHRLRGMMEYLPDFNPRRRRAPSPRPDFAVFSEQTLCALLDAKYRDLWGRDLPREMLYQLSIYALSMPRDRRAIILYPTESPEAREAVVGIREPIYGGSSAWVVLRPVHLVRLDTLLAQNTTSRHRASYAKWLAFGA